MSDNKYLYKCLGNSAWQKLYTSGEAPVNVKRYYKYLCEQPVFSSIMKKTPKVEVKGGGGKDKKTESSVSIYTKNIYFHKI